MAAIEKVLWVVNYNTLNDFLTMALQTNASAVAVRTDNDMEHAITEFHKHGIKVYGWRWPSARRDAAIKEANKAASLILKGMDGYYVDPEGDPGKPWDWDQSGLDILANDFCKIIKDAIVKSNSPKIFGVTSHYRGKKVFGKLPWKIFFNYADLFLPQAYWRTSAGTVGHGIPADNYKASLEFWTATGATPSKIVPMAGEIHHATASEINQYAKAADSFGVKELHFYTYEVKVSPSVWTAIAKA
ncbi:hypothetical protein PQS90_05995 [Pseudomonas sp. BLCC-B13]|uniref:hypothetical protein n=1 Tax=Pseudomonas sp. BLCC-B13 TaxID=3025314 RepID=UPI00234EF36E|nr:hypothetical protein [Pseudomonas sp. BLCC-B13]MDC7824698.1 hypothetical protein [Pseudomonas sp. BLCC-B13]